MVMTQSNSVQTSRCRLVGLLALAAQLLCAVPGWAQPITVAAASDLQSVMPQLTERFQRETGHAVTLTFGSSGNFLAQIQNGAPFDVFFSADIDYPKQLEMQALTEPGSLYEYAIGKIVVWTRADSGIDIRRGLAALDDPRVRRIAIANPAHAPYGRAAVAALQKQQLYEKVRGKLVLGENISQAAQFVQSGNAEVGILALSLALAPALASMGSYAPIPEALYPAIEQGAVILRQSKNKNAARQFLAFVKRPDVAAMLKQFGFTLPPATSPTGR